jgi:dehydrogenase/reductase SDR family member 7B
MMWLVVISIGCFSLLFVRWFSRQRMSLHGKTVLITGASSGLGEALARRLYRQYQCSLILVARRLDRLQELRDELSAEHPSYPKPQIVQLDLADVEHVSGSSSLKGIIESQPIDCLINNAGVSQRSSTLRTPMIIVEEIFRVNYMSLVRLTQMVLEKIIERQQVNTTIVNISSMQGLIAVPDRSSYSASKHAVQAFSDALRMELREEHSQLNINVCVVSPSYIRTELGRSAASRLNSGGNLCQENTSSAYEPDYVAQRIVEAIEYRQTDVIIAPFHQHLAIWLRRYWPQGFYSLMVKRNQRLKARK